MSDPWIEMAESIARHCGRVEPEIADYRAVGSAMYREIERLRGLLPPQALAHSNLCEDGHAPHRWKAVTQCLICGRYRT